MEYRANLFATKRFGYFLVVLFAWLVFLAVFTRQWIFLVVFLCLSTIAVARLYQRKMLFDGQTFYYDTWFVKVFIPLREIRKVEHAWQVGYPADRLHGPLEYRITTQKQTVWVSLLFFDTMAKQAFKQRFT